MLLPLLGEPTVIDGGRTDSHDFTTLGETESEQFAASSSSESGGSDHGFDTEQELVLAIMNKEKYKKDLNPLREE